MGTREPEGSRLCDHSHSLALTRNSSKRDGQLGDLTGRKNTAYRSKFLPTRCDSEAGHRNRDKMCYESLLLSRGPLHPPTPTAVGGRGASSHPPRVLHDPHRWLVEEGPAEDGERAPETGELHDPTDRYHET